VYDLRKEKSLTFESIAGVLMAAYPEIEGIGESDDYFSDKNCENFWKAALSLLNGGYKEYMVI
jgi:hypothetical protein